MDKKTINLEIVNNYYHLNADKVLHSENDIFNHINESLNNSVSLPTRSKKTGKKYSEAFNATDLHR